MQKSHTKQYLLLNPNPLAYLEVMSKNTDISAFSTRCCISSGPLQYPVINLKCTSQCYMEMDQFLKVYPKPQEYKCKKCGQTRNTGDVVYDIGLQTILIRVNNRKTNALEELYIDKEGMIHKEKKVQINESISKKMRELQTQKITQIRQKPQDYVNSTISVDLEGIRNEMNSFYKGIMEKLKVAKSFLFCRGKRAERGGKQWFTTIYIFDKQPFHLLLCHDGKEIAINKDSEIHFITERQAFYILANQGKQLRLFKGSISNIIGNRLQLQETKFKLNPLQFFGVAHSDKHLYLVGGVDQMKTLNKVAEINLDTYNCDYLPPMKEERGAVKACYFQNKLFVIGGAKRNIGYTAVSSHECFDFNKRQWSSFQTTFKGFNIGIFASDNNLVIYGGSEDPNNQKFHNKYYLMNANNFNIVASGKISDLDLKLEFGHENPGMNGYILRAAEKPENQLYLFNFSVKGSSVNNKLRLDV